MLEIMVEKHEFWDEGRNKFFHSDPAIVKLEHSLISISKWESIWEKPFLPVPLRTPGMMGQEEEISYIECMIIGKVDSYIPFILHETHPHTIREYMEKSHTATKIYSIAPQTRSREIITSEVIYYWMIKFNIPKACERWHFNRLMALIEVCSVKEAPKKTSKVTGKEAAQYMQKLNEARKSV